MGVFDQRHTAEEWTNIGHYFSEGVDNAKALEAYNQALAVDPEHRDAYYYRGKTYFALMAIFRSSFSGYF
jgi:tetratricopeptide (TPR) repeat protein